MYSTDPTYKEWKPLKVLYTYDLVPARILPTRNGNMKVALPALGSYAARILPTRNGNDNYRLPRKSTMLRTDPTYKEWKPNRRKNCRVVAAKHGSYLQGMETICALHNVLA